MSLLFDQNLSRRLPQRLADLFAAAQHVRPLRLDQASDAQIWEYARANTLAIVTKDSDFIERSRLLGSPPKVVWLRCGNSPPGLVEALLRQHANSISELLSDPRVAFHRDRMKAHADRVMGFVDATEYNSPMVRHTITLPDDTAARVQEALNGRSFDEFAAEALEQHARRAEAGRKLRIAVEEAEASGEPIEIKEPGDLAALLTARRRGRDAEKALNFLDALEDCDDVQKVHANHEIDEEEMAKLEA